MEQECQEKVFKVKVQLGKETHIIPTGPLEFCKVEEIMSALETLTGVLKRTQKLIFKGKVLEPSRTLAECKIADGAKLMCMPSKGGVQSAGQAAAAAAKAEKEQKLQKIDELLGPRKTAQKSAEAAQLPPLEARANAWKKTGIVGLRDSNLTAVPAEVVELGSGVRVLDLTGNQLPGLPLNISRLADLQRLSLAKNCLTSEGIGGETLSGLRNLTTLILDDNRISRLPDSIGQLQQLKHLSVNRNELQELPSSMSGLQSLEVLHLHKNQLKDCLHTLTVCMRLSEVDASHNKLIAIPESMGSLQALKALNLDKNLIAAVPPTVLKNCVALCTLSLHDNPVTAEQLRETEGFKEYEARRQSKYSKQLGMRTMLNRDGFDEGIDVPEWRRW